MEHKVVSEQEWLTARRVLLTKEKQLTHLRDEINRDRLALPWVRVTKQYVFDMPEGKKTLADLFNCRSQLLIYHFMLGPGWGEGCKSCSFIADGFDGMLPHLENHDVTLMAISRAPLPEITAYKTRMGWHFPWASAFGNDFNHDYHVSFTPEEKQTGKVTYNFGEMPVPPDFKETELPGLSAFSKNESGEIFHTYSTYTRGLEEMVGTLMMLDRAPLGRNEKHVMDFVRRHDEYENAPKSHSCCS